MGGRLSPSRPVRQFYSLFGRDKQLVSKELKLSQNPLYLPALLFFGLILAQIVLRRSAYGYVTNTKHCNTSPMGLCC